MKASAFKTFEFRVRTDKPKKTGDSAYLSYVAREKMRARNFYEAIIKWAKAQKKEKSRPELDYKKFTVEITEAD